MSIVALMAECGVPDEDLARLKMEAQEVGAQDALLLLVLAVGSIAGSAERCNRRRARFRLLCGMADASCLHGMSEKLLHQSWPSSLHWLQAGNTATQTCWLRGR
jgi:hypothetical protein